MTRPIATPPGLLLPSRDVRAPPRRGPDGGGPRHAAAWRLALAQAEVPPWLREVEPAAPGGGTVHAQVARTEPPAGAPLPSAASSRPAPVAGHRAPPVERGADSGGSRLGGGGIAPDSAPQPSAPPAPLPPAGALVGSPASLDGRGPGEPVAVTGEEDAAACPVLPAAQRPVEPLASGAVPPARVELAPSPARVDGEVRAPGVAEPLFVEARSEAAVRIHVEESAEGLHVWIGLRRGAGAPLSALLPAVRQELERRAAALGRRIVAIICNGETVWKATEVHHGDE